jgi:hypothetical protein
MQMEGVSMAPGVLVIEHEKKQRIRAQAVLQHAL